MTQPESQRTNRPPMDLEMIGVRVGDELAWHDDRSRTCIVVKTDFPAEVYTDGRVYTLTDLAQTILGRENRIQVMTRWVFEGETLRERRARFQAWHARPGSQ